MTVTLRVGDSKFKSATHCTRMDDDGVNVEANDGREFPVPLEVKSNKFEEVCVCFRGDGGFTFLAWD